MTRFTQKLHLTRVGRRLLAVCGLLAGLGLAGGLGSAAAQAALPSFAACNNATLTQPFTPWGDTNDYELVPGGDFESGLSGWSVTGGAKVVAGSEPSAATGTLGSSSLYLPAGATAVTPMVCVDAGYPDFRFFARNDSLLANVLVSVNYVNPDGQIVSIPVGTVLLSGAWAPTAAMATHAAIAAALANGMAEMQISFTAVLGPTQIDDVFVDPHCK
jgi:hypothetical protein